MKKAFTAHLDRGTGTKIQCGRPECGGRLGWVYWTPKRGLLAVRWETDILKAGALPNRKRDGEPSPGGLGISHFFPAERDAQTRAVGRPYQEFLHMVPRAVTIALPPGYVKWEDAEGILFAPSEAAKRNLRIWGESEYRRAVRIYRAERPGGLFSNARRVEVARADVAPLTDELPTRVECPECGHPNHVTVAIVTASKRD